MGVDVRCPACHSHTRIPDNALGRNIRCKKCNYAFLAKSGQGVEIRPSTGKSKDNRLLLYILTAAFVILVIVLITLRLTGVM
jgi:predicted Zn finger-like uncharacterized protein